MSVSMCVGELVDFLDDLIRVVYIVHLVVESPWGSAAELAEVGLGLVT